jgi:hypothetical protein
MEPIVRLLIKGIRRTQLQSLQNLTESRLLDPRPLSGPDTIASTYRLIPASDPAMTQASPSHTTCIGGVYAKYPITRVPSSRAISLTLSFLIRHKTLLVTSAATNSTAVRRYAPPLPGGVRLHPLAFVYSANS